LKKENTPAFNRDEFEKYEKKYLKLQANEALQQFNDYFEDDTKIDKTYLKDVADVDKLHFL